MATAAVEFGAVEAANFEQASAKHALAKISIPRPIIENIFMNSSHLILSWLVEAGRELDYLKTLGVYTIASQSHNCHGKKFMLELSTSVGQDDCLLTNSSLNRAIDEVYLPKLPASDHLYRDQFLFGL